MLCQVYNCPYIPKAVSKYYTYDWQFAAKVIEVSIIIRSSTVIVAMPIILQFYTAITGSLLDVPLSLWATWLASLFYVVAWVIFKLRCPTFVAQYHDYGQYKKKEHSHRWIIWEIFNNIDMLQDKDSIIRELIDKGLAYDSGMQTSSLCCRAAPLFSTSQSHGNEIALHNPVNLNRDLYIPIECDGRRFTITLQETDPSRSEKEKEFFWVLLTPTARSRPTARVFFWGLIPTSIN